MSNIPDFRLLKNVEQMPASITATIDPGNTEFHRHGASNDHSNLFGMTAVVANELEPEDPAEDGQVAKGFG